jgi:hypothetical protein
MGKFEVGAVDNSCARESAGFNAATCPRNTRLDRWRMRIRESAFDLVSTVRNPHVRSLCKVVAMGRSTQCLVTISLTLSAVGAAAALSAQSDAERLAEFIQSPPPIREMVVECNWYSAARTTTTNWIVLCWQTNAFILRNAKEQVALFDKFETNKDGVIAVRKGDTYSVVCYYKLLGVHTRQVQGLRRSPDERDIVTPMLLEQLDSTSIALTAGVPLGRAAAATRSGLRFRFRNDANGTTTTAVMEIGHNGATQGFQWTNEFDHPVSDGRKAICGPIRYTYGGRSQPSWFPHEITRDLIAGEAPRTICRLVVHRLELGGRPLVEFDADRFLPGPPRGSVVTSNGVSFVKLGGLVKPVMDPKDPRTRGTRSESPGKRQAVYLVLVITFVLGPMLVAFARWRKRHT